MIAVPGQLDTHTQIYTYGTYIHAYVCIIKGD